MVLSEGPALGGRGWPSLDVGGDMVAFRHVANAESDVSSAWRAVSAVLPLPAQTHDTPPGG